MPNIDFDTLAGIPDISHAAMTQPDGSASCGAYSIIAAVGAFHGTFPRHAHLHYDNIGPEPVDQNSIITVHDNYEGLANAAYAITGILNFPNGHYPVFPELSSDGDAYNSPAAMAQVAIDLGRQAHHIHIKAQPLGFAQLSALYPGETERCRQVVGLHNVDTHASSYAPPNQHQTSIVCVHNGQGGLHWVAQGSNGHFYDPDNGSLNNEWNPIDTGAPMGHYTFAGLWIVIG